MNVNPVYHKVLGVCRGCRGSLRPADGRIPPPLYDIITAQAERCTFQNSSGELVTPNCGELVTPNCGMEYWNGIATCTELSPHACAVRGTFFSCVWCQSVQQLFRSDQWRKTKHAAALTPETSPFTLTFITGNIRVCRGCRQKYSKPALPLHNLCV